MGCNWLSAFQGMSPNPGSLEMGYSEARQAAGHFGAIKPVAVLK